MVFHMYQDLVGNWRWYLAAPNDVKLAIAPVGYARRGDCIHAINRVREGIDAPIIYDNYGPVAHVHSAIVVGTTASA